MNIFQGKVGFTVAEAIRFWKHRNKQIDSVFSPGLTTDLKLQKVDVGPSAGKTLVGPQWVCDELQISDNITKLRAGMKLWVHRKGGYYWIKAPVVIREYDKKQCVAYCPVGHKQIWIRETNEFAERFQPIDLKLLIRWSFNIWWQSKW